MAVKVNGTTVIDDSRNVCAVSVCACCIESSSKVTIPSGNTASRPTGGTGELFFDTDEGKLIAYDGSDWAAVGGGTAINMNEYSTGSMTGVAGAVVNNTPLCTQAHYEVGYNNSTALFFHSRCGCCNHVVSNGSPGNGGFRVKNGLTGDVATFSGGCGTSSSTYCCGQMMMNDVILRPCGIEDTDPRATIPILTTHNCTTFPSFLETNGSLTIRCTGNGPSMSPSTLGNVTNFPKTAIFRQYGVFKNQCNCGIESYGDSCCGVTVTLNLTKRTCYQNAGCIFLDATFGYKPCYFYSTETCADAASSPVRFQRMCGGNICCGSNQNAVVIDWSTKTFWTVTGNGVGACCNYCRNIMQWCICDKGYPNCQSCWCMATTPMCRLFTCCMHCVIQSGAAGSCCTYGRGVLHGGKLIIPQNDPRNTCGTIHVFPTTAGSVCGVRLGRCGTYVGLSPGLPMGLHHDKDGNLRGFFAWSPTSVRSNTFGCNNCSVQGVTEFMWAPGCDISTQVATNMVEYHATRHCSLPGHNLWPIQCICTCPSTSFWGTADWLKCSNNLVGYNNLTGKRSITGFSFRCGSCTLTNMLTSFVTDEPAIDFASGSVCCFMTQKTAEALNHLVLTGRGSCIAARQCIDNVFPTTGHSFSFHYCCGGCVKVCTANAMGNSSCGGLALCPNFCSQYEGPSVNRSCLSNSDYLCLDSKMNVPPAVWPMCTSP